MKKIIHQDLKNTVELYFFNFQTVCEDSSHCTNEHCIKFHPYGRLFDGTYLGDQEINDNGEAVISYDSTNNIICDDNVATEFFPKYRSCKCCKGYIYNCQNETCLSIGQCCCSMADEMDKKNEDVVDVINDNVPKEFACSCCCGLSKRCPNCPEGICICTAKLVWYPESAECTCCKGYKYKCENPSCNKSGQCLKCKKR